MAARLFAFNAIDVGGGPASGAKLNVYTRSTTTRTPWYTDVGLSTPATNPIVADADGRFEIYFQDASQFTIECTTADAATNILEADIVGGVLLVSSSSVLLVDASWLPVISAPLGNGWPEALAADFVEAGDTYTAETFQVPDDGVTDGLAATQAWLAAAAAAGYWADGVGKTIALSDTLDISAYTGLKLRDVTFKLLNPDETDRIGVYNGANDNVHLQRVKVNRNGTGLGGAITTSHGIMFFACDGTILEDCDAYGNNKGNGVLLRACTNTHLIRPKAHDIRFVWTSETDDETQGIWIDACVGGTMDNPLVQQLGKTDLTSATRDRFGRGIVFGGSRDWIVNSPRGGRLDQFIDLTGSDGNQNIVINDVVASYIFSNGVKGANTAVGNVVNGGTIEHFGLHAVLFSGPDDACQNMTQDNQVSNVLARNGGVNAFYAASSVRAFSCERESASTPQGNHPKGSTFFNCKNASDEGSSAFTVYSTNTLALTGFMPISRGVRCRLTTSGTLPTGLALATDYYLIEVTGQNRIQLASSYINAIDGVAIGSISGGSGTHTATLFSNCYDGFFEDIVTRDPTRPNRAENCSSVGHTNKALNGINGSAHHAFSARLASDISNITGDGTLYTVVWDTEVFDPSDSFSLVTGRLTAKVTGKFLLNGVATLGGVIAGHDRIFVQIATTARNYSREFGDVPADSNTRVGVELTCIADMTEGDTAEFQVFVAGSTKVVDVISGANSYFTGTLLQ